MVLSDTPHYPSDRIPPTTELSAIMIGMENMRLQSRMDLSPEHLLTSYDHLHCALPVMIITFDSVPNSYKMEEKHFFFKVSTHSLQLRVKFKPFFHCWQLQLIYSYRTSAAPIFALKLWTCLLHTLNSQRGFVMKHAWSWTIYTQQYWNLLLLMACWKRFH